MTQADKELLLKDLCARLPYGIKAEIKYGVNKISREVGVLSRMGTMERATSRVLW